MRLEYKNIIIRNAELSDARQLCDWWNDGEIMEHAGFPNGLGCTLEKVCADLSNDKDDTCRRHIIELDGKPSGEMIYRNIGNNTAEIGIKICDFSQLEKGYGTIILSMFIDALFYDFNYNRVIIDTDLRNIRAQHVYQDKLGFRCVEVEKDARCDQLGIWQTTVTLVMNKVDWKVLRKKFEVNNKDLLD